MKNETPFNPIPLPENLKLSMSADPANEKAPNSSTGPERPGTAQARKRTRKVKPRSNIPGQDQSRWQRIKNLLSARVAVMDSDKLKSLLLASGVAAGLLAAVLVAIKMVPAAVLILAILGIGAALRFWDRIRHFPLPF